MTNLPTTTYEGAEYNYRDTLVNDTVVARTVVDFGLIDTKGRKVGMSRRIDEVTATLKTELVGDGGGYLWKVGRPLHLFQGVAISTRNGSTFGSAMIEVEAPTLAECEALLDAAIARARKAATRKWAAA